MTLLVRQVRDTLNNLKREYPQKLTIYKETGSTYDPSTGENTIQLSRVIVNRAIILPSALVSSFRFASASVTQNRDFAYGGQYPIEDRQCIIDARDLPKNYEVLLSDYVVFDGSRYDIKSVGSIDPDLAWSLILRKLETTENASIAEGDLSDAINLNESYDHEL